MFKIEMFWNSHSDRKIGHMIDLYLSNVLTRVFRCSRIILSQRYLMVERWKVQKIMKIKSLKITWSKRSRKEKIWPKVKDKEINTGVTHLWTEANSSSSSSWRRSRRRWKKSLEIKWRMSKLRWLICWSKKLCRGRFERLWERRDVLETLNFSSNVHSRPLTPGMQ